VFISSTFLYVKLFSPLTIKIIDNVSSLLFIMAHFSTPQLPPVLPGNYMFAWTWPENDITYKQSLINSICLSVLACMNMYVCVLGCDNARVECFLTCHREMHCIKLHQTEIQEKQPFINIQCG
jgi:hypothetical protein